MKNQQIYQLGITLLNMQPEIWRRVLVPGDITLDTLHMLIHTSMGWENSHLHQFIVGETMYSDPSFELEHIRNECDAKLIDVAPKVKDTFIYKYGFGDSWEHRIIVEKILDSSEELSQYPGYPICTEGARACPPDDVGGTPGYEDFLLAIKDPQNEQHEEILDWIGGEKWLEYCPLKSRNNYVSTSFACS